MKITWMIMLCLLLIPLAGQSSTRVGNGGSVLVCVDPLTKKESVSMLDLYEGKKRFGLTMINSNQPYKVQIDAALAKMRAANSQLGRDNNGIIPFAGMLENIMSFQSTRIQFIDPSEQLQLIDDANFLIIPRNCERQQLAIATDSQTLVDPILYRQLDETSKAAFFLHEAMYYLLRDYNKLATQFPDVSSDSVRKSVAYLFSTTALEPVVSPEAAQGIFCKSESKMHQYHRFYAFVRNGKLVIEFVRIYGEVTLTNTRVEIDPTRDSLSNFDGMIWISAKAKSLMLPDQNASGTFDREDFILPAFFFNPKQGPVDANYLLSNMTSLFVEAAFTGEASNGMSFGHEAILNCQSMQKP